MELGGGGAKLEMLSSDDAAAAGEEDRLSALPKDILVLILLKLSTRAAAQTSVLSRSWRHIWALLPELSFTEAPEPHRFRELLDGHEVAITDLRVQSGGATPESLAVWLPAAAHRVSGNLTLSNHGPAAEDEEEQHQAFVVFPCFEKATSISISLSGFQGLAVPLTGVFARLTSLQQRSVRFHGPGELGDAVSSARCPCLQWLTVHGALGLHDLTIRSNSLLEMALEEMHTLSQLTVVAPALWKLTVRSCFYKSQPAANISAPQLAKLFWMDSYDPSSVHLGKMEEHLRLLCTHFYLVYGPEIATETMRQNQSCPSLLQRFEGISIESLVLTLMYPSDLNNYQYLMEDMTVLPAITILHLIVVANGHAFEASAFHVLRLCTGIRSLTLHLDPNGSKGRDVCPSGCICIQLQPETEVPLLDHLKDVEITGWGGTDHEVAFVKRLLNSGTKLKEMTVVFHRSISEVKANELFQRFQSFSRPGVCMKFYLHQENNTVLYTLKD